MDLVVKMTKGRSELHTAMHKRNNIFLPLVLKLYIKNYCWTSPIKCANQNKLTAD